MIESTGKGPQSDREYRERPSEREFKHEAERTEESVPVERGIGPRSQSIFL